MLFVKTFSEIIWTVRTKQIVRNWTSSWRSAYRSQICILLPFKSWSTYLVTQEDLVLDMIVLYINSKRRYMTFSKSIVLLCCELVEYFTWKCEGLLTYQLCVTASSGLKWGLRLVFPCLAIALNIVLWLLVCLRQWAPLARMTCQTRKACSYWVRFE